MAGDFKIVVVPHVAGEVQVNPAGHPVSFAPGEGEGLPPFEPPDALDLGEFDPPDVAALEEKWRKWPGQAVRLRVDGSMVDLARFEDEIAAAKQHGSMIQFHVY